jgi:4-methyl-5(b-hydroxyethyl)-thiazole monophosphate biosynthesis
MGLNNFKGGYMQNKVLLILARGFEEIEAITAIDILRRAGIETTVAGLDSELITGSHNIPIKCDTILAEVDQQEYSHLVLPGGQPGTNNLEDDDRVLQLITDFNRQNKVVAAICAAPTVLQAAGILAGKRITSYPAERQNFISSNYADDKVVQDNNIITSRGVGTAIDFALTLVENIKGREIRRNIAEKILWPE